MEKDKNNHKLIRRSRSVTSLNASDVNNALDKKERAKSNIDLNKDKQFVWKRVLNRLVKQDGTSTSNQSIENGIEPSNIGLGTPVEDLSLPELRNQHLDHKNVSTSPSAPPAYDDCDLSTDDNNHIYDTLNFDRKESEEIINLISEEEDPIEGHGAWGGVQDTQSQTPAPVSQTTCQVETGSQQPQPQIAVQTRTNLNETKNTPLPSKSTGAIPKTSTTLRDTFARTRTNQTFDLKQDSLAWENFKTKTPRAVRFAQLDNVLNRTTPSHSSFDAWLDDRRQRRSTEANLETTENLFKNLNFSDSTENQLPTSRDASYSNEHVSSEDFNHQRQNDLNNSHSQENPRPSQGGQFSEKETTTHQTNFPRNVASASHTFSQARDSQQNRQSAQTNANRRPTVSSGERNQSQRNEFIASSAYRQNQTNPTRATNSIPATGSSNRESNTQTNNIPYIMNGNDFNTQKMIRAALSALPNSGRTRGELIKFISCADAEFSTFRTAMQNNPPLLRIFVKILTGKLDEPIFTRITSCNPRDYFEFRKALIKSTSLIRPRNIIETEAKSIFQLPGENALTFLYRIENLIAEYMFALQCEEITEEDKAVLLNIFERSLLEWIVNALASPLNVIARSYNFETIDDFKEFLQKEKEREESIAFITQRSMHAAPASYGTMGVNPYSNVLSAPQQNVFPIGAILPSGNQSSLALQRSNFLSSPKDEEVKQLKRELEELKQREKMHKERFQQQKLENHLARMMSSMSGKISNEIQSAMRNNSRRETNNNGANFSNAGENFNQRSRQNNYVSNWPQNRPNFQRAGQQNSQFANNYNERQSFRPRVEASTNENRHVQFSEPPRNQPHRYQAYNNTFLPDRSASKQAPT
jgi:hypothetical protein